MNGCVSIGTSVVYISPHVNEKFHQLSIAADTCITERFTFGPIPPQYFNNTRVTIFARKMKSTMLQKYLCHIFLTSSRSQVKWRLSYEVSCINISSSF
nr:hypothetical protein BaRGS_034782 [Batillaria attramentaria]